MLDKWDACRFIAGSSYFLDPSATAVDIKLVEIARANVGLAPSIQFYWNASARALSVTNISTAFGVTRKSQKQDK
jgi:hypothetical protein